MGKETKRMKRAIFFIFPIVLAATFSAASAFTLSGTVTDEAGTPVPNALVKLLIKGDSTTTGQDGKFSIQSDDQLSLSSDNFKPGHIDIVEGVLRFSQSSNSPVQVSIFDMVGNLVLRQDLLGSGQVDLRQGVTGQGTYFAKVRVGSAIETIRFTANGTRFSSAIRQGRDHKALLKPGEGDTLSVSATGFDPLKVALANLDTAVTLKLTKTADERTYAFGYALKNAPTPSKGCGTQRAKARPHN